MALLKANHTQVLPSTVNGVVADLAIEAAPWQEPVAEDSTIINDPKVLEALAQARNPVEAEPDTIESLQARLAALGYTAPAVVNPVSESNALVEIPTVQALVGQSENLPVVASTSSLSSLAERGFSGLAFDWTSFASISLKTEGEFVDFDGQNYGKEFTCRLRGSKERWVYRANPVLDNKRDVAFSYDRVTTQNGILIEDKRREWIAQGKNVEEKLYIEVMVEMVSPGEVYDGEYRILSVSPTSKGRFTGHASKCAALGGGDPGEVVSRILVGAKITKVANPFWPWAFEVVKD